MRVVHTGAELRAVLGDAPKPMLVPTMGALHEGHLSLVRLARNRGCPVVATIFVNRLQFAPNEDFDRYPRRLDADIRLLDGAGCDVVFAPAEHEMNSKPPALEAIPPAPLTNTLEGEFRPGFFGGVCTVVRRLFDVVQPAAAVFGKKDYQQLVVIREMVRQLGLPIDVISAETVREADGLAMSSRNGYLTSAERHEAPQLRLALLRVTRAILMGRCDWRRLGREASDYLRERGWTPDYVAVRRRDTLGEPADDARLVVLAAARLGSTRLIDNLEIPREWL